MQLHLEAPFTLDLWEGSEVGTPVEDPDAPATGVVRLAKTYAGDLLTGTATGFALTTMGPRGSSYVAQEVVVGTLAGRTGSFVVEHGASTGDDVPTVQQATVVAGSGTGGLTGLRGTGRVEHGLLTLDVELPDI